VTEEATEEASEEEDAEDEEGVVDEDVDGDAADKPKAKNGFQSLNLDDL